VRYSLYDTKIGRRGILKAALALGAAQVAAPIIRGVAQTAATKSTDIATYTGQDRERMLLEGARKEGMLTIYTSATVEDITALTTAFEKKYGIKPAVWRASSEDVVQRAITEARGNRFAVDVFETNSPEMESIQREKLLQEVRSPAIADLVAGAVRPDRQWIGDRVQLWVAAYNTNEIRKSDLPKSYQDLLDSKWKGKLGIEAADVDWFQATVTALGERRGLKLFRDIVAKNGISVRKGHTLLTNLVVAGEVPMALTVYGYKAKQLKDEGAPIDWFVIPPQIGRFQGIGMARHAAHPHAAALFIDWVLSDDGQRVLANRDMLPANANVVSLPNLPHSFIDPAKFLDESDKWDRLYQQTFNQAL
jgi:iron(III) transport system substrate-binding protein